MRNLVTYRLRGVAWLAVVGFSLGGLASADGPPADGAGRPTDGKKSINKRTLDDELLEGLGVADPLADPLADLDAEPQPDKAQPDKSQPDKSATEQGDSSADGRSHVGDAKKKRTSGIDDELLRGLGEGEDITFGQTDNPLTRLNRRMRDVQRRIAEAESGGETQRLEQDIARELADLIKQTEQACRACQKGGPPSGANRQPGKQSGRPAAEPAETPGDPSDQPARESSARLREQKTAPVGAAEYQELLKDVWGHLPAHLRQQMEQSANEEFLPKYSLEIADYYRALVERRRRQ